jgi:hypothetical protein
MTPTLRPSAQHVLTTLVEEGALEPAEAARGRELLDARTPPLPWYVRGFTGFGAWVAALFACAYLWGYHPDPDTRLRIGLLAILCAIGMRRRSHRSLPSQLALVLALAGEIVAIGAVHESLGSDAAAGLTLGLELGLLAFYPDPLMRFMATIGASCAAIHLSHVDSLDVPFLLSLGGALWLFHARPKLARGPAHSVVAPAAYGLSMVALGIALEALEHGWHNQLGWPAIIGAGLLAGIVTLRQLSDQRAPLDARWLAFLAVAALAAISRAPGLLAAISLMAVAFGRRETKLLALSSVFLLFFGAWFYYSLSTTLLGKSLTLAGSGALLLVVRAWAEHRFASALEGQS